MYPKAAWRLLLESRPLPGAVNLAIDESLLRGVASGKSPPTLRFYRWQSPTLVLGRGQRVSDVDKENVLADKIVLLRRMTGGTAVLNDNVISYTVAVKDDEVRLAGSIAESYRGISIGLAAGLRLLGILNVQAEAMTPGLKIQNRAHRSPVCFEIPSYYEITVDGKKLVGSSQMRVRGGILQHGTIYLDGDIGIISHYLSAHPEPQRIRSKTITLREALDASKSYETVAEHLIQGCREALNLELTGGSYLPSESLAVEQLVTEKYENCDWTSRL
jgi:lipoate-protein ligase A